MPEEIKEQTSEIKVQCTVDHRSNNLIIAFNQPISHLAFNREQALDFLKSLKMNVEKLG